MMDNACAEAENTVNTNRTATQRTSSNACAEAKKPATQRTSSNACAEAKKPVTGRVKYLQHEGKVE
jgi:hypothetical protein